MTSTPSVARPSVVEVQRIAAVPDAVLRNLQITQCYYDLSAILAARTGQNANWCTFATWASNQAGQSIRREDVLRALEERLHTGPEISRALKIVVSALHQAGVKRPAGEIQALVWELVNPWAALDRAADAVARGNFKVFAEIAQEFARFLETCLADSDFDAGNLERFCKELKVGDPPEGQRYLAQAFTHYYQSFFEPDAKQRAELMLMANIEIGFHEQTRLQPEIAEALNGAFMDPQEITTRLLAALFPAPSWLARLQRVLRKFFLGLSPVEAAVNKLTDKVRQQIRQVVTESLMTLTLHGVKLRLGQDLKVPYPPSLQKITNSELQNLLAQVDPTPDSLQDTGALDWADLAERLHFIIDLFRCYQQWPDLFEAPFPPDSVAALKEGQLPASPL